MFCGCGLLNRRDVEISFAIQQDHRRLYLIEQVQARRQAFAREIFVPHVPNDPYVVRIVVKALPILPAADLQASPASIDD